MSKRRDSGSHDINELEMKDTVSYNIAVQLNQKGSNLKENPVLGKGEHQKGTSGKRGGGQLERKRK